MGRQGDLTPRRCPHFWAKANLGLGPAHQGARLPSAFASASLPPQPPQLWDSVIGTRAGVRTSSWKRGEGASVFPRGSRCSVLSHHCLSADLSPEPL